MKPTCPLNPSTLYALDVSFGSFGSAWNSGNCFWIVDNISLRKQMEMISENVKMKKKTTNCLLPECNHFLSVPLVAGEWHVFDESHVNIAIFGEFNKIT